MVENMRNMSALLETEAKKREELTAERKKWMEQLDEKERLLDEALNSSEDEVKVSCSSFWLSKIPIFALFWCYWEHAELVG